MNKEWLNFYWLKDWKLGFRIANAFPDRCVFVRIDLLWIGIMLYVPYWRQYKRK